MPDARLGIQISADVANLVTGMTQGSKSVADLESKLLSLQNNLKGLGAGEFGKLNSAIASVKPQLSALEKASESLKTSLSGSISTEQFSSLNTSLESVKAKFASLSGIGDQLKNGIDEGFSVESIARFDAQLEGLKAELASLSSISTKIKPEFDTSGAVSSIKILENQIEALERLKLSPDITTTNIGILNTKIAETKLQIDKINQSRVVINSNSDAFNKQIDALKQKLEGISEARVNINTPVADFNKITQSIEEVKADLASIGSQKTISVTGTGLDKLNADITQAKENIGSLTGKEVVVKADTSQAKTRIDEIRAEINSLTANASVGINAGDFEARIKSISDKIASLTDAKLNISADPTQAEAAINELTADLNNLRDANVILKADGTQAIKIIDNIESQLQSLQADIKINAPGIQAKAAEIKEAFGQLNFTANVDDTQINATVKNINEKLSLLSDPSIDFKANPAQAENAINEINGLLATLKDANVSLSVSGAEAVESFISQIQVDLIKVREAANIPLTLSDEDVKAKISDLKNQLSTISLSTVIGADTTEFNIALAEAQAKIAALDAPDIDITANKEQVVAAINEISGDLSKLNDLSIKINADSSPAIKSIIQLENELGDLSKKIASSTDINEIKRLGDEFRKLESKISNIKVAGNLDRIGESGKRAADNLRNLPRSSNAATQSLINLGRVAQDAPFGIIGIANNINPLLESFQRLRAESTSTGAALKSFGASLIGGGGIGLGVSIITGLLTQFALSNQGSAQENNKWAKAIQENADAVRKKEDDFRSSLDKASASLLNQTDKLQDLNKILVSTAGNIDEITAATIRQGVAQFVFDKKNVELQKLLNAEIQKELRLRKQSDIRATVPEFDFGTISKDPFERQAAAARETLGTLNFLGAGLESFFKTFVKTSSDLGKIEDETISRAKQFAKEFGKSFVVPELEESFFVDKNQIFKRAQQLLSSIKTGDLIIKLPTKFDLTTDSEFIFNPDDLKPPSAQELDDLTKRFFDDLKPKEPFVFDPSIQVAINKENALKNAKSISEDLADSLRSIFVSSFSQIGEDIGNLIASGGGFNDLFKGVAAIIGSGLSALGKQMIALSPVIAGLKAALKTLNPAVLLPAGIALVAIGTALRATVAKGISGFAGGGYVSGPGGPKEDKIPALLSNGEFVVNAAATRKNLDLLRLINNGFKLPKFDSLFKLPKFAEGGLVSLPSVSVNLPNTLKSFLKPQQAQPQIIFIKSRVRGRDQILQMNREERSQRLRR